MDENLRKKLAALRAVDQAAPISTDDLQKLLDAATPGPWAHRRHWADDDKAEVYPTHGGKRPEFGEYAEIAEVSTHSDNFPNAAMSTARLISLGPQLAAEVLALRALVAELRGAA